MKRIFASLFIILSLVGIAPAFAQDAGSPESTEEFATNTPAPEQTVAPEPSAVPTVAPIPPSVNTPELLTAVFNLLSIGVGFFMVGGFSLAGLLLFLSRRDVQDQLENAYKSADPATQERIRQGYERGDEVLSKAIDLLTHLSNIVDKVTDGKANTDTPAQ